MQLTGKEGVSERSLQPASDHDLDAITNITHTTMLKQEEDPSSTSQATKLSSSSLVVFPPIASIADMPSDRCREDLSSSSSRAVLTHAPQREFADLPDISAMLIDRTMMKQQWIESEQLLFSLVGELRMRVKEESERHHNAQQKVQVTSESNATLQAQNSRLQTDIAVMGARIADFQSRIQELDADCIRLAEVYEASRSQMAAQLASVRQGSMEASFVLEGLATAKSRWEAEDIQTAYNKVKGICESRQEEVNQYRTRCQSLSDQLRYLSEKVEELNRENDELRVASEALQVTNHTMSDRIEFLKQANEYQQSILIAQLRDVEIRCCESNADELSKIKHELAGAKEVVKDVAVLESRVREGTLKAEDLTTRNAQLDTELGALKESTARHQEIITQLQETKRRLESENQRLMQSSMSAQADYVIELNATVERCEELRQRQVTESQTVIDDKDEQIGELTRHLETNTREFQKLTGEKQQLVRLACSSLLLDLSDDKIYGANGAMDEFDYQAQTAAATDREMLELRVKIQLLQSDHDFVTKARNDLRDELEALQQAHEAQQWIWGPYLCCLSGFGKSQFRESTCMQRASTVCFDNREKQHQVYNHRCRFRHHAHIRCKDPGQSISRRDNTIVILNDTSNCCRSSIDY
ncbi:hypothetical protein KI688_002087 [Linnemannia hyalina]|uniref:Uncharacterized protein n=1 Tax=Linnemannia hyalina TaxID=64524 RepID=A0A9P7XQZ6_9FUNG|nr:hypothetical protein KI688_002087 [Linnemannia hyalina]